MEIHRRYSRRHEELAPRDIHSKKQCLLLPSPSPVKLHSSLNICNILQQRETNNPTLNKIEHMTNIQFLHEYASFKKPIFLQEYEFDTSNLYDKLFSSTWFDNHHVVFGTKCNKINMLNVSNGFLLPLHMPPPPPPPSPSSDILEGSDSKNSSIHSLVFNQNKEFLCASTINKNDIGIFTTHDFKCRYILHGHERFIFCCDWIDNFTLASGSQDNSLKIWSIPQRNVFNDDNIHNISPLSSLSCHPYRVRTLKYHPFQKYCYTLSDDGLRFFNLKSSGFNLFGKVPLDRREQVCMALQTVPFSLNSREDTYPLILDNALIAVGSQNHIDLIDIREAKVVQTAVSLDEGWGVRSLNFAGPIITIGGGFGNLSFYDIRAGKYLEMIKTGEMTQSIGGGWICQNDKHNQFLQKMDGLYPPSCIYTTNYNFGGTKLFTGGGPCPAHLFGSYAALWF